MCKRRVSLVSISNITIVQIILIHPWVSSFGIKFNFDNYLIILTTFHWNSEEEY